MDRARYIVSGGILRDAVGACIMPGQRWVVRAADRLPRSVRRSLLTSGVEGYIESVGDVRRSQARSALCQDPLRGIPVLIPVDGSSPLRWIEAMLFEARADDGAHAAPAEGPSVLLLGGSGQVLEYEAWNVGLMLSQGCKRVLVINYSGVAGSGRRDTSFELSDEARARKAVWEKGAGAGDRSGGALRPTWVTIEEEWSIAALRGSWWDTGGATTPRSMSVDALCGLKALHKLDRGLPPHDCLLICDPSKYKCRLSPPPFARGARHMDGALSSSDLVVFGHSIGAAAALDACRAVSAQQRAGALRSVRLSCVADRTFRRLSTLAAFVVANAATWLPTHLALLALAWILSRVLRGGGGRRAVEAAEAGLDGVRKAARQGVWHLLRVPFLLLFLLCGWEMVPGSDVEAVADEGSRVMVVSHESDAMMVPQAKLRLHPFATRERDAGGGKAAPADGVPDGFEAKRGARELLMHSVLANGEDAHNRPLHTPYERAALRDFLHGR